VLVGALAAGGIFWQRARNASTEALLARMPAREAVLVSIDFAALRRAGVLQMLGSTKIAEEPEYRAFVQRTSFDYQRDLDSALVAFTPTAKYLLLRGRFDWKALRAYAQAEKGSCDASLCRMQGSTPERRISFLPLQSNVMALAVSPDSYAALTLASAGARNGVEVPDAPVWVSLPPVVLRSGEGLPAGTRMFARGMENAESVAISVGPDQRRFAARLNVRCRNAADASEIAAQLTRTTTLLRALIQREHKQPNPSDLSGLLTSGSFRSEGPLVHGYWPIERQFLENLLAGNT
jgi:hypothetical protein